MNIIKYIKEWWKEWDIHFYDHKKCDVFETEEKICGKDNLDFDWKKKCNIWKSTKFFDKIAWIKLDNIKKNEIAQQIVDDSFPTRLYWIQLFLSCVIVALWLFMNSIPVIIWAMLISPLLDPIKSLAFAITNGHKRMYFRSIKILLLSIVVAIISSVFVSFIVPFSHITSEIMARVSPTMIDLFVAFFSWAVAFLSLWFKKLQETVAGVAIAVALLPPLSIVWMWIFFLDFSITQGSFLLFLTNLVAILTVWVMVLYMFWFFPTNKIWQKRSFLIFLMVFFFVLLISFPLQKSMSQISYNIQTTNQINETIKSYFKSIDTKIDLDKISFHDLGDDLIRVKSVLNVPNDILITSENKNDLTKLLSLNLQKSIELDLNIVEISSVYISKEPSIEHLIIAKINNIFDESTNWIFLLDYKFLEQEKIILFLNLYSSNDVDKDSVYYKLLSDLKSEFLVDIEIIIQWQINWNHKNNKTQQELELERQFALLFSWSELEYLDIQQLLNGSGNDYMLLDIKFTTYDNSIKIRSRLREWKIVLEQYFDMEVTINSKIQYFSRFEI